MVLDGDVTISIQYRLMRAWSAAENSAVAWFTMSRRVSIDS